jgi:hypothetical protein
VYKPILLLLLLLLLRPTCKHTPLPQLRGPNTGP